ncbi:MAG: translocation/assembly module TamB domain-containing protein [Candidatus Babeliales bacterium]
MIVRSASIGLLIGSLITLVCMQYDPWVKQRVGKAFKELFETSIGCRMHCSVQSLHLWQPALVLQDVRVTPRDEQAPWYWTAKRLIVSCNWWHVCCYGIIDLHVVLEDSHTYSSVSHGVLAINDHVNTLFFGSSSSIPLFTKSVIYKRAHLHLADTDSATDMHVTWNSESKKIDNHFKSTLYCIDGSLADKNKTYVSDMQGSVYLDMIFANQQVEHSMRADCSVRLACLPPAHQECHIDAEWYGNQGTLHIANDDHSLHITPVAISSDNNEYTAHMQGTIPLNVLAYYGFAHQHDACAGTCSVALHVKKDAHGVTADGTGTVDDGAYHKTSLGAITMTGSGERDAWHGSLTWMPTQDVRVEGAWQWQQGRAQIECMLRGETPISIMNQWYVQPGSTGCTIAYDHTGITGSYHSTLHNTYQDTTVQLNGHGTYSDGIGTWHGTVNDCAHVGSLACTDTGYEGSLRYNDDKQAIATFALHNTQLSGSIHIPWIKDIVVALYGGDIQGDGSVRWDVADYQHTPLTITCTLDGTLRIPQTYNAINEAQGIIEWDYNARTMRMKNVQGTLYKGSFACHQATVFYDDTWHPFFIQAPCIFNDCLLNVKKDLFALMSGHMTYTYQDAQARLTGLLTIDHSQLKENIFSEAFANRFLHATGMMIPVRDNSLMCDVTIKTKVPTHIKTAFLDTTAAIDLHVTHSLACPEVAGTLSIGSGQLSFPYKPLYITQGSLYCVPGRLYDPLIEFTAKNSIKNHTISLHVTGSLSKPHVTLESWPPLTQEQIVSLLLVGSYQESLNMVMPALVMNNITSLLFGENHTTHTSTNKFVSLLEPFKRIRLVPSFTDQTGRGGLRGAIEVDVSDRVHAVIQKNFSLTEDTYFELGYLLSDDINVRLLRDERRDMGAEVEMRWKFGS